MKSAKALAAVIVPFIIAVIKYVAPQIPEELLVLGSSLLLGLVVYLIPNKE